MTYNNDHAIQLIESFLTLNITARRFEVRNGLVHGLIDKAKRYFVYNNIHSELVERLNNKG